MQRTPSALLHLPFYKRFDSKSIPWKITDNLHTFRVVLPILIITIIKYPFTGPKRPEWTFLYHIVISVLSGYLSAFRTKIPDVVGSQRRNSRPSAIPKTTDLKIEFFERNQSVMKHFSNLVLEAPELVNEHGKVYGEWLFPIDCNKQNVIFYLHGGAYVTGSCQMGRGFVNRIGSASNAAIFSINYRLAPQNPFPCGLIDSISGIIFLIQVKGYNSKDIVIVGDSAGGGLAIATVMALRDMGLPKVAGVYCASPWVDLTHSFETFDDHGHYDYIPSPHPDPRMPGRVHYYCPDDLHKYPLVSPIFQTNFSNLPPLLMQLGTAERLYGEGVAFCKRVSKNESAVALQTYHSHVHVFQIFSFITGSKKAILDGADWIKQRFGGVPTTEENYFTKFDFNGQFIAQEILE